MTSHILLYHNASTSTKFYHVQYICISCDKALQQTSDENPLVPYHAKYANAVSGAKFLKALNQRPEYLYMLPSHVILQTVQQFISNTMI